MPDNPPPKKWGWILLTAFDAVLVVVFWYGLFVSPLLSRDWALRIIPLVGIWLVVTIPMCVMYLLGSPIVMSLSPLVDSPASRAYQKELRKRPELDDDLFFNQYYADTDVPKEIPLRIRQLLARKVDHWLMRVQPNDLLYLINDDLDGADVLKIVEKDFGCKFAKEDVKSWNGSFDWLVQYVKSKRKEPS
jgi:acyl carrier protein